MALIKCKECGTEISTKAKLCPKCGAPNKQRTSAFTWLVTIIAGVFLVLTLIDTKPSYRYSPQTNSSNYSNSEISTKNTWEYYSNSDSMTGKTIYYASIKSSNFFEFNFPYSGSQRATLTLRTHPRYGKDILLEVEKGQFICGISDGCNVLIRFDDGKAVRFHALEPEDHSTTVLFINNYSGFAEKMLKSKAAKIQASFFQEGSRTFEFNVADFDVEKYRPKQ